MTWTSPAGLRRPVVLVTGASSGIGAAAAALLARSGRTVFGASRRANAPPGVVPVRLDVADPAAARAAVEQVLAAHGRLDVVVNAAGWGLAGAVETTPVAEAMAQMETNLWGTVRVTLAALPALRASGDGLIVNVSSLGGVVALPFQAYYSASKYALEGWSEALAYEVAPFGVGVTLVEPGNVRTGFTAGRVSASGSDEPPYGEAFRRAVGAMERDELAGAGPEVVARVIGRAVGAERPPRRVTVGTRFERFMTVLHRILPVRIFERLARDALLGK
jgi:NAD(P)-dependent dehydrogenase (short-subunit alcohol dehydrogenase family)